MEDKIKVSIQREVLESLKKDCEDFKFAKPGGGVNFNAFINTLISNFYESFSASEEQLYGDIRAALADVPACYADAAFQNIIKAVAKRNDADSGTKNSVTFSFKPTKLSQKAILYINTVILHQESVSSFYRRMFTAYSKKTKTEREKILFSENIALLRRAIEKGAAACVALKNGTVIKCASIYSVSPAKDELFNYVLLYDGKHNVTLRLAGIQSVNLTSERAFIPKENAALFARQVACGAQYPMYNTDNELIKVRLTEKGKELFKKIYLYRPTPVSIKGDVYSFDCSANQLIYYFERFGERALIISPKRLGIFMRNFHYFALKKYNTIYGASRP